MAAPAPGKDLAAMTIARIVRSGWKNYAVWMRPEKSTKSEVDFDIYTLGGNTMIGKYVIVRGDRSGVFAGVLESQEDRKVVLREVRRLWRWSGATESLQIATEGVKKPRDCRFTLTADSITLLDVIEIIPTTAEAEANIKAVPVWKM